MKKLTAFDEIQPGDDLLIVGEVGGGTLRQVFTGVQKKESNFDGQEVILQRKGNKFFNFGMYLQGRSWVKACYNISTLNLD